MLDNVKVNLNEVSWYLWIVVFATIFSIFSIIHNSDFIYFGFITFAYGVIGHIVFSTYDKIEKVNGKAWVKIILHIITLTAWFYFIVKLI